MRALRMWRIGGWVAGLGLLAGAAILAGCILDDSSMGGPAAVSITITGAPTASMSPGQGAQLTANAAFDDGTVQDVTATATWDTTDPGVLTVSSAGWISAAGPGRADVSASLGGTRASVSAVVVVLPAAYFHRGLEYAFEYQLDANGRVANYRITYKPEVDYGGGLGMNQVLGECQGDLYGTYACYWLVHDDVMRGGSGRVAYVSRNIGVIGAVTYSYGSQGLSGIGTSWTYGSHNNGSTTIALAYDSQGRLATVEREDLCYQLGSMLGRRSIAQIAVDAKGRLAHAEYASETFGNGGAACNDVFTPVGVLGPTDWTYDSRGYMIGAGTTSYVVDADGWLSGRSEDVGASPKIDTYSMVREGTRVAEESFTQAEPRAHYVLRDLQRVRYEWGRLPSEPLFVPRALTGLNGADYFGIISSHHR